MEMPRFIKNLGVAAAVVAGGFGMDVSAQTGTPKSPEAKKPKTEYTISTLVNQDTTALKTTEAMKGDFEKTKKLIDYFHTQSAGGEVSSVGQDGVNFVFQYHTLDIQDIHDKTNDYKIHTTVDVAGNKSLVMVHKKYNLIEVPNQSGASTTTKKLVGIDSYRIDPRGRVIVVDVQKTTEKFTKTGLSRLAIFTHSNETEHESRTPNPYELTGELYTCYGEKTITEFTYNEEDNLAKISEFRKELWKLTHILNEEICKRGSGESDEAYRNRLAAIRTGAAAEQGRVLSLLNQLKTLHGQQELQKKTASLTPAP